MKLDQFFFQFHFSKFHNIHFPIICVSNIYTEQVAVGLKKNQNAESRDLQKTHPKKHLIELSLPNTDTMVSIQLS